MQHHPVMYHFRPFCGDLLPIYSTDFLGTKIRHEFAAGLWRPEGNPVRSWYPEIDEEYFEWIDLLEAVVAAKNSYTMIDLGAGFGRWVVRAACAVRQLHGSLPTRLIAVEAEPLVFQWMHRHFEDNGIDLSPHRLIHAAVSETPGDVSFYIARPQGGPFDRKPNEWYGQFLTKDYDIDSESVDDGEYCGFKVTRHKSSWRSIRVPTVSLKNLVKDLERVDLIDMDIEGQELPAIQSAIEELDMKVKRMHVGTHSSEIEEALRQVLSSHGWHCCADYGMEFVGDTLWGKISFENGVQSWVNPRL